MIWLWSQACSWAHHHFQRGRVLPGPAWSLCPVQATVLGSRAWCLTVSKWPPVVMEEFLKGKGGSITRREMGIHAEQIEATPYCRAHHIGGFTAKLWSTVRQEHHLRGLPSLASRIIYLPQLAHSRWQLPSPLYSTLYPPFPFGNPLSSQGNGRHLMNCKHKWGASSCCCLSTTKLGITIHSIKHFKWHNQMRGLWFQKH